VPSQRVPARRRRSRASSSVRRVTACPAACSSLASKALVQTPAAQQVLLDDKPGPVFLLAWGGESTTARALESIQLQYQHTPEWPAGYKKVSQKAIIQASGQQDDTRTSYIVPRWPDIRINYPSGTGGPGGSLGYAAELTATTATAPYCSPAWIEANITMR
jgi:cellulose-binding protein